MPPRPAEPKMRIPPSACLVRKPTHGSVAAVLSILRAESRLDASSKSGGEPEVAPAITLPRRRLGIPRESSSKSRVPNSTKNNSRA